MFSSNDRPSTSSSSRGNKAGYVNPTFQSSVFNHVNEVSATRSVPDASGEIGIPSRKKIERLEQSNFVIPKVQEWNPKSGDVNNPDAYRNTDKIAADLASKKISQENQSLREHKEKLNSHVREEMNKLEQKHQSRLDHKKPSEEVRNEYRAAETAYINEAQDEANRVRAGKTNYADDLVTQAQKKSTEKQIEQLRDKNDTRTGFAMKPRKEYDMQEYKDVLKKQLDEKSSRVAQAKQVKQNEREARLEELRNQERMVEHLNKQLNDVNRPQSAKNSASATSLQKTTDWEATSAELLRKKDEADLHRQSLQSQIEVNSAKKWRETQKNLDEERAIKGFDLKGHRPKVTTQEVADVIKTQMKEKQQVKDKEVQAKQASVVARNEDLKNSEKVAWEQYNDARQQKAEKFEQYKNDQDSYAVIKKNQGLMTVKI